MTKKPKREEKREKRAERTTNSCGEQASKHPRACSRVGGEASQMESGRTGGGVPPFCGARSSMKSLKFL